MSVLNRCSIVRSIALEGSLICSPTRNIGQSLSGNSHRTFYCFPLFYLTEPSTASPPQWHNILTTLSKLRSHCVLRTCSFSSQYHIYSLVTGLWKFSKAFNVLGLREVAQTPHTLYFLLLRILQQWEICCSGTAYLQQHKFCKSHPLAALVVCDLNCHLLAKCKPPCLLSCVYTSMSSQFVLALA